MATGTKKLEIIITASARQANRVFNRLKSGMRTLVNVGAKVGLGLAAGVGVATVAFTSLLKRVLDTNDGLAKTADKLGITTEALASLRQAAVFSGLAVQDMDRSLQFMQRNIAEAADGVATQAEAFEKLGISVDSIKNKKPEDAMLLIVTALGKLENQTEKTQVAMDIFGRSGAGLLNLTAESIERATREAALFGTALNRADAQKMEQINDNFSTFSSAMSGFGTTVVKNLSDPILKATNYVVKLAESGKLREWAVDTSVVMIKAFAGVTQAVGFIGEAIIGVGRLFTGLQQATSSIVGGFAAIRLEKTTSDLRSAKESLQELIDAGGKVEGSWQLDQVQTLTSLQARMKALADSSVKTFDEAGESSKKFSDLQGKSLASTDKIVAELEKTKEGLLSPVAQAKELADQTERAARAMQNFASISSNIQIPSGQRVLTGSGSNLQIRTEGE